MLNCYKEPNGKGRRPKAEKKREKLRGRPLRKITSEQKIGIASEPWPYLYSGGGRTVSKGEEKKIR